MLYPTQTARESIAVKLGVDAPSLQDQDWEWCVASPELFEDALRLHRAHDTSDLERVCLIEILLQCIAEAIEQDGDHLPRRWPEIEALLTAQPQLHKGAITCWAGFEPPHEYAPLARAIEAIRRESF